MKRTVAALSMLLLATGALAGELSFSDKAIHVGVVVRDLEQSVAFYKDVVGLNETGSFDVPGPMAQDLGLTRGVALHVKVLRTMDSEDAAQFKLMSFEGDADTPRSEHIEDALGMQYITLMVADLTPFIERIEAKGVPFLGKTPLPLGDSGNHFVLIQDPDGTFIELIGPRK